MGRATAQQLAPCEKGRLDGMSGWQARPALQLVCCAFTLVVHEFTNTLSSVMLMPPAPVIGAPCSKNEYIKVNYGQQPFKFDLEVRLWPALCPANSLSYDAPRCLHISCAVLSLCGGMQAVATEGITMVCCSTTSRYGCVLCCAVPCRMPLCVMQALIIDEREQQQAAVQRCVTPGPVLQAGPMPVCSHACPTTRQLQTGAFVEDVQKLARGNLHGLLHIKSTCVKHP